jgi:hypothetical protein
MPQGEAPRVPAEPRAERRVLCKPPDRLAPAPRLDECADGEQAACKLGLSFYAAEAVAGRDFVGSLDHGLVR